ncbi:unnamed protein product, partial [Mesorhabditis belari]|uniref:Uncharacterized protein n=1 Tax=Mesorhabditis belari TaxID=2138241 RepID=A0AAF3ETC0_9BILA
MFQKILLNLFIATTLAISIDDLEVIHNKTQALASEITTLMTTETDKNGIDSSKCSIDDCLKLQKTLNQLIPEQVALVRQAVYDYQPTSKQGNNFKKMIISWLQDIVKNCSTNSISACLSDTFTLNKHAYLPFLSHPNVMISYAQLIKANSDEKLMEIFSQLPWCLGDSFNVDCGVSYRKGLVWRVDAMCYVSKGNFSNCRDYMKQSSSGVAK